MICRWRLRTYLCFLIYDDYHGPEGRQKRSDTYGEICLTSLLPLEPGEQRREAEQIHHPEPRLTPTQNDERIDRRSIGPRFRHVLQATIFVVEVQTDLPPRHPPVDHLEGLAPLRNERVGYPKPRAARMRTGCSRQL